MMHPMLNIAIQAARQASKVILRFVDQMDKVSISKKSQNDFVTQVDQLAEEIIITEIQKAYPKHTIMAEESGRHNQHDAEFCWIIDPIDGTRNFMQNYPHFCISIGIMKKGVLELGMIYDPLRQELFTATRGQGAYLNNRRLRVSNTKKFDSTLIGTGFPYAEKESIKKYLLQFESIFMQCSDIRRSGSAALDLAYVAAGRLDGFWQANLQLWDIAAGVLMIKEAGGMVTDFKNTDMYLENGDVVASNLKIHQELIDKVSVE